MAWFILAVIGVFIGVVAAFIGAGIRMPAPLIVGIAVIGALAGGALDQIAGALQSYGVWTFYVAGAGLSIALLAGSFLAFNLTSEEQSA